MSCEWSQGNRVKVKGKERVKIREESPPWTCCPGGAQDGTLNTCCRVESRRGTEVTPVVRINQKG